MAAGTVGSSGGGRVPWRLVGWGGAGALLLLPLITNAPWSGSDYVFAAILFGVVGGILELAVRMSSSLAYRAAVAAAVAAAFLIVWANAAVGMIGSEDNPFNLLFGGVIAVALAGAAIARFRARGMARAMLVAAVAQVGVAAAGLSADPRGGVLSAGFAGLWLLSAALFWKASQEARQGSASA